MLRNTLLGDINLGPPREWGMGLTETEWESGQMITSMTK